MFSICVIINKGYGVKMRLYFYYIIFINVFSFLLYGLDKFAAKINIRRIKEKLLLNISIFGGVYGSLIGMYLFHHKTRKKLFISVNYICFIIYTIFIYILWRYL
jgi:uncharacterized membrane protein YsdA (DUF1294 family)